MKKLNKEFLKEYVAIDTRTLVLMGVLVSIDIVLERLVSFQAWHIRIGFSFIAVVIAAMMLGPVRAGIMAAVSDIIGALLFPVGTFFPGFTLTAFLVGMIYGIFLFKKQSKLRVIFAVGIHQCILSLLLNTLWISILYGSPYWPIFITRVMQTAIMIPVELVCIIALCNKRISHILVWKQS